MPRAMSLRIASGRESSGAFFLIQASSFSNSSGRSLTSTGVPSPMAGRPLFLISGIALRLMPW